MQPIYLPSDNKPASRPRRLWCFLPLLIIFGLFTFVTRMSILRAIFDSEPYDDAGLDLLDCQAWSFGPPEGEDYRDTATAEFEFDLPSKNLLFLSRGNQVGGSIHILQGTKSADKVFVNVVARFLHGHENVLDYPKVCLVQRDEGEQGVALFTSRYGRQPRDRYSQVSYEFTVHLPSGGDDAHLSIHGLETQFSNFVHHLGDLSKVAFDKVSLSTSNGHIDAKFLSATDAIVRSSNGRIVGNFNTTKSLELSTSNGKIDADVGLQKSKTSLNAHTTNGALRVSVDLTESADYDSDNAPSYSLTTKTTNGHLNVDVNASAPTYLLDLVAKTTNGRAEVKLPHTYQGKFQVATSNHKLGNWVVWDQIEDPTGRGRKRIIEFSRSDRRQVDGTVEWVGKDSGARELRGSVTLETSNAPVVLNL